MGSSRNKVDTSYGFQTLTKIRMVLSVALVDAAVKDSDVVAIFRAVHQLLLRAVNNPFLSLPESFTAKPAGEEVHENGAKSPPKLDGDSEPVKAQEATDAMAGLRLRNEPVPDDRMFRTGPEDLKAEWLARSNVFTSGIERLGSLLSGPRG